MNFSEAMDTFFLPIIPQLIQTPRDKKLWREFGCDESIMMLLEDMLSIGIKCKNQNMPDGERLLSYIKYVIENTIRLDQDTIAINEYTDTTLAFRLGSHEAKSPILVYCCIEPDLIESAERYSSFMLGYLLLRKLYKYKTRITGCVHFVFTAPKSIIDLKNHRTSYISAQKKDGKFIETSLVIQDIGMPKMSLLDRIPDFKIRDTNISFSTKKNPLLYVYKHERWPNYGLLQSYICSAGFSPQMVLIPAKIADTEAALSHNIENFATFIDVNFYYKKSGIRKIFSQKDLSFERMEVLAEVILAYLKLDVAGYSYGRIKPPKYHSFDHERQYFLPPYEVNSDKTVFWPPTAEEQYLMTDDGRRRTLSQTKMKGSKFGKVI